MTLLSVREVSRTFGGVQAVRGVSFDVDEGEVVGVMGPNGAGKTTLFSMIAGALPPSGGEITFASRRITGWSAEAVAAAGIVRTDQNTRAFEAMSALDNVIVGALLRRSPRTAAERARELLAAVGLEGRESVLAGALSTGQRKRLEVARAMATEPRLLLLDEMTGGVDQRTIPALVELMVWLNKSGVTLLVIEHNQEVMMSLATRIVAMNLGEVIAVGTPDEVAHHPAVIDAYLGPSFRVGVASPGDRVTPR